MHCCQHLLGSVRSVCINFTAAAFAELPRLPRGAAAVTLAQPGPTAEFDESKYRHAGLEQGSCAHERPARERGHRRGVRGHPEAGPAGER